MSENSLPGTTGDQHSLRDNRHWYTNIDPWWWLLILVIGLIFFLANTKPETYGKMLPYFVDGIRTTAYITGVTFLLVLIFGLIVGLGRLSHNRLVHGISTIYVEIIRGIPMMVQIIFWYFALPAIVQDMGKSLYVNFGGNIANPVDVGGWMGFFLSMYNFRPNGTTMAIFGLTFGYSAYMSEVYRAGIQSISKGQMEAARSLGMTYFQAMRYVILPQAVRVILPPMGNEFITLLKDTSLVSAVAVPDLTRRGREYMASNFIIIQTWIMVALIYLTMTLFATRIVSWLERKAQLER
ncbi:MAG: amino acid ABC transporter permease [Anaerolineaceae bacterium]